MVAGSDNPLPLLFIFPPKKSQSNKNFAFTRNEFGISVFPVYSNKLKICKKLNMRANTATVHSKKYRKGPKNLLFVILGDSILMIKSSNYWIECCAYERIILFYRFNASREGWNFKSIVILLQLQCKMGLIDIRHWHWVEFLFVKERNCRFSLLGMWIYIFLVVYISRDLGNRGLMNFIGWFWSPSAKNKRILLATHSLNASIAIYVKTPKFNFKTFNNTKTFKNRRNMQ